MNIKNAVSSYKSQLEYTEAHFHVFTLHINPTETVVIQL